MVLFDQIFNAVIGLEGGYTNDPRDPGGETKFGISKRAFPTVDICALTLAEARAIYSFCYWRPIGGDHLPPRLAWVAFDMAVNQGVRPTVQAIQAAAGVTVDGILGPQTLAAILSKPERDLFVELHARRALRYAGTSNFPTFGLGWFRRLATITYDALAS